MVEIRIFMNFLSECPLQHDRANWKIGLVMSFQAFACVASVVLLTALVFAASVFCLRNLDSRSKNLIKNHIS